MKTPTTHKNSPGAKKMTEPTLTLTGPGYAPCPEHEGVRANGDLPFGNAFAIAKDCNACVTWGEVTND